MVFYIEEADRSLKSAVAGEDILVGLLVEEQGDGTVDVVDDSSTRWDGIADLNHRGGFIAEDWDDPSDFTYDASASNVLDKLVAYGGNEDGAKLQCRTIKDPEDGDADALSVDDGTVVGVAQVADADYYGRVVQEGYSDGTTTYDRATGNFIPVGVATQNSNQSYHATVGFDDLVRVEVRDDL